MIGTINKVMGFATAIAMSLPSPAQAQGNVALASVVEETLSEAAATSLRTSLSDEYDRLQVQLQANQSSQTPGALKTSTTELAGLFIAGAMRRALVVQPHGSPVLIGLDGQVSDTGARQIVLVNLTAWINHGRVLDPNHMETFEILPDERIRQGGAPFTVEGVGYVAVAEGQSVRFHRAR